MNKKNNPDLVRKHQYTVWLNKLERDQFLSNLEKANGVKESDFMRQMITQGYVQAPVHKADKIEARELLKMLLEYRTNFNRISNYIKNKSPELNSVVEATAKSIQRIIERL